MWPGCANHPFAVLVFFFFSGFYPGESPRVHHQLVGTCFACFPATLQANPSVWFLSPRYFFTPKNIPPNTVHLRMLHLDVDRVIEFQLVGPGVYAAFAAQSSLFFFNSFNYQAQRSSQLLRGPGVPKKIFLYPIWMSQELRING